MFVVLALSSCKITQQYKQPLVKTDSLYRSVNTTDTTNIADMPYTQLFKDANLQAILREAISNNNDLKVAIGRIKEAAANLRQSKAAFLPTLSVEPEYTRQKVSAAQGGSLGIYPSNSYEILGSASWEVDIWGKLKSSKKAALASLLQSDAYKRYVQTQVISDVATDYYNLLAYDKQLAITIETVENRKEDVETNKALKQANMSSINEASVAQSEANRYSAEVTIPDL